MARWSIGVALALLLAASTTPALAADAVAPALPAPCALAALGAPSPSANPAALTVLAPVGASAVRLCRYNGSEWPRAAKLAYSGVHVAPGWVAHLVRQLDTLPAAPQGPTACPADDAARVDVQLAYPALPSVTVSVGLLGCQIVTNGSVVRTAFGFGAPRAYGPALAAKLERLTGYDGLPPPLGHGRDSSGVASVRVPRLVSLPRSLATCVLDRAGLGWRFRGFPLIQRRATVCGGPGDAIVRPDPIVRRQAPRARTRVTPGHVVVLDDDCTILVRKRGPLCQ
jgi:hypothetical protein